MKSVVNDTDGIVRVAESVIPEIKHQDEVRVKIASSGLCGSDLPRIFKNGAHYYPITLGHEFSGYIDAVGPVLMIYILAMRLPVCRYYPVLLVQSV